MVRSSKPARRSDGRPEPPPRYPKDPAKYADPLNWKYPVHTPFHARAARRYFNEVRNRSRYRESERLYIDRRIDAALRRFGVASRPSVDADGSALRQDLPTATPIEAMGRDELLRMLLGTSRFRSASTMAASMVTVTLNRDGLLLAKVKQYGVRIDPARRLIAHECEDFERSRAAARLLCKHLGRLVLNLPEAQATSLLRRLLRERETWEFRGLG